MAIDVSDLIRTVAALHSHPDNQMRIEACRKAALAAVAQLSETEKLMLGHIASGWSRADIATAMNLEPAAAEQARKQMLRTLNAGSTIDAVRIAIYADLT